MSKDLLPGDGPNSGKGQFLVYEAKDGRVKIDVRLEDETVWLTQQLMGDLFQTAQQNISLHIQNVYEEGELAPEGTHKGYLSVRWEGSREVRRLLDYYNLDMIISVGYRVKSHVATRFWTHLRQFEPRTDKLHGQMREAWKMIPTWAHPVQAIQEGL